MSKRKSSIINSGALRASRASIMLTPQERLQNFKQTVSSANATVTEKSQVVRQNIKKKLEKRKRRMQSAQTLLQQLGEMSGINDANLLYGEKPPMSSTSMMMDNHSFLQDANTVDGQQIKPKKDFRYKLKSFKRRAEQKVLETFGKSPQRKMKETEFDVLWDKVATQEAVWKELKIRCKKLEGLMQEIGNVGSEISELLVELCQNDDDDSEHSEMPKLSTLPLLKLQYSLDTISKDTIPRVLENQFHEAVSQPLKDWKDDFPSYEACIQKRDGLARDVDAYERKLMALEDKAIDRRDPAEIARRKDQLARAERRFKNFNKVMISHFKEIDAQKYEKGQIIGDGVLETFRLWHDTSSQLLPPPYTFESMRNTPKKDSPANSDSGSLPAPPSAPEFAECPSGAHVRVNPTLDIELMEE